MNFYQKHKVTENGFDDTFFTITIADDYNELLNTSVEVSCINVESIKEAFNESESSFSINELPFSINELACLTDNDKNCLSFCLEAKDSKKFRYIACYETTSESETPTLSNQKFIGKINPSITADDLLWTNTAYSKEIGAKREYKFNSSEFAIAILDEVLIKSPIYDAQGNKVDNIFERITRSHIDSICSEYLVSRLLFNYTLKSTKHFNLFTLLNTVLNRAGLIVTALTGDNITFELLESDLGLQVLPYKLTDIYTSTNPSLIKPLPNIKAEIAADTYKVNLVLKTTASTGESSIFLSKALWDSSFIHPSELDNKTTNLTELDRARIAQINSEKPYCFTSLENVSALLFEIARSFNCYLKSSYSIVSGNLKVSFQYVKKTSAIESEVSYIYGVSEARLDSGSEADEDPTIYYANTSNLLIDNYDYLDQLSYIDSRKTILPSKEFYESNPSKLYEEQETTQKRINNSQKTEFKRLLLSSGYVSHGYSPYSANSNQPTPCYLPLNTILVSDTSQKIPAESIYQGRLSTLIHILMPNGITGEQGDLLGTRLKPVAKVLWNFEQENYETSLSEYVSMNTNTDRSFFLDEYNLTIPYYSAFAKKDGSGNITSIGKQNIKLGSVIRFNESYRAFISGNWTVQNQDYDFVVVAIEKSLTEPLLKLTLHRKSRFAYGIYDGTGLSGEFNNDYEDLNEGLIIESYQFYEVDSAQTISIGDAVVLINGKIRKAKAHTDHYGLHLGIAKDNGTAGDSIRVDSRVILNDPAWTFTVGLPVYVRLATPNLSQDLLTSVNDNENMIYEIGVAVSPTTINSNLLQLELEV